MDALNTGGVHAMSIGSAVNIRPRQSEAIIWRYAVVH
jgi:hypothetical protein